MEILRLEMSKTHSKTEGEEMDNPNIVLKSENRWSNFQLKRLEKEQQIIQK